MAKRIERDKVIEACKVLGFDPNDVYEMRIDSHTVLVTSFQRGPENQRIRGPQGSYYKNTTEYPITSKYGADNEP